jgi:hypothetical protein
MTQALTHNELNTLFTAVGAVVIQWGQAEQTLDMIVAIIFRSYGGDRVRKKIPQPLSEKIKFIRNCLEIEAISPHKEELNNLANNFERLSNTRHDIIHGAVATFNAGEGSFQFSKLDLVEGIHYSRDVSFDMEKFPDLLDELIHLGASTIKLAKELLSELTSKG